MIFKQKLSVGEGCGVLYIEPICPGEEIQVVAIPSAILHLDEYFSGLRRAVHFPQERDPSSLHAILGFQAQVKAQSIHRSHLRLLCIYARQTVWR